MARCSGREHPNGLTFAPSTKGRTRCVPNRYCGSRTSISPNFVCQRSFFHPGDASEGVDESPAPSPPLGSRPNCAAPPVPADASLPPSALPQRRLPSIPPRRLRPPARSMRPASEAQDAPAKPPSAHHRSTPSPPSASSRQIKATEHTPHRFESHPFRASELLPTGFCALSEGDSAVLTIRAMSANSSCPSCGAVSDRVHSRYPRRLADLPIAGRRAVLMLQARRFRCAAVLCERRIFTERFDDNILKPWARRTARLDQIVHCLALALGGRPAASFALRLSIPVSNDTLLRAVRRRGNPSFPPPVIIGIDDWAWRRNHRYGTLICDLERRKTIALLPDREAATAEAWLIGQPQIAVVARDRGGGFALAAQRALPNAMQVADRWHLMENASHAFLDAVRKSMRPIRAAIGAATVDPDLLTAAEKLQYEGYLRREETNAAILAMAKEGATIKEIVRSAGYSRGLVRKVLRGQRSDVFRVRSSSLEAYLP